jgi:hypothetical protein
MKPIEAENNLDYQPLLAFVDGKRFPDPLAVNYSLFYSPFSKAVCFCNHFQPHSNY